MWVQLAPPCPVSHRASWMQLSVRFLCAQRLPGDISWRRFTLAGPGMRPMPGERRRHSWLAVNHSACFVAPEQPPHWSFRRTIPCSRTPRMPPPFQGV